MPRHASLFVRLLAHSVESETYSYKGTCCWEWTGSKRARGDYGRITVRVPGRKNPVRKAVHRVMAELAIGRQLDPDAETIQHACEIPWCINFLHFEIATRADNSADMQARRNGKPRKHFKPLVDPGLYAVDRFIRSLPTLKSAALETSEIPF